MTAPDPSNGYEAIAADFIEARSDIGSDIVRSWAARLETGARVLDLGCGHGDPNMPVLLEAGLRVSAIDASPHLLSVLRDRFPEVETACEPVETSDFFGRQFDGVLAIGLIFLLPEGAQGELTRKVSKALHPGGRFLFSAPTERGEWEDLLTKRRSQSLGVPAYTSLLKEAGFDQIESLTDQGNSHHYSARKV
ncbi:MAG: class I SAM-dependent methyltransferase [Pseudomonadota bacterium]